MAYALGAKAVKLLRRLHASLKRLRRALLRDTQVRYAVVAEETGRTPCRHLDYVPARVAVPLALLVGTALAWAVWTLPAVLAVPVFLLFLGGGAALAFRGDPVLVTESPAVPQPPPPEPPVAEREGPSPPPERPSLVPAEWWVDIPAGSFRMGSPEAAPGRLDSEGPQHEVGISAFRCLRYPVTKGLERRLDGDTQAALGQDDPPLVDVSWLDAVHFCNRLSEADGLTPCYRFDGEDKVIWDRAADGYRLLTEAEWEYACRAGTGTHWSFGDDEAQLGEHAWYSGNSGGMPHPVGQKRPNPWGLHDMHGLVWEWCWDWYGACTGEPQTESSGPPTGDSRVLRGGSFVAEAVGTRSANRFWYRPVLRVISVGFRCVRAPRRQP